MSHACRVSGHSLTNLINFGLQPLGNGFLTADNFKNEYFYPMSVGFCEVSKMFQLLEQPSPEKMFHEDYAFFSSTSTHMAKHFKDFSDQIIRSHYFNHNNPFVVELGCNDGILLKNFAQKGISHLGIEPSKNVAHEANKAGVHTISEFFSEQIAENIIDAYGNADVFLSANVMCHIPDILSVARGVRKLLKPTGILIFEDPYLGDVVNKSSYDQIYDEHVFLFSALSVSYLFSCFDMELVDVQHQTTHGGSMRYYIAHRGAYPVNDRVRRLLSHEIDIGLNSTSGFGIFKKSVEKSKSDLVALLTNLKLKGKKVVGYAATSKSTTILNYCGIGPELISYICDTTPLKQGKYSPGTHIPIVPYEHFKADKPDFALLFAWNHSQEILEKENEFTSRGGKWITHVPEVQIL